VKILLLHQHFATPQQGGALRSYYLATALARAGHDVVVITAHAAKRKSEVYCEGFRIIFLPVRYANQMGFWARSWAFLRFALGVMVAAAPHRNSQACYAISTPLTIALPALWLRFRYGMPFYFEVGDLWPEAPIQLGFIKNPLLKWLLRRFEVMVYRQSKAVVALSVAIQAAVRHRVPEKPVHLIPNMADTEFFRPQAKPPELVNRFGVGGRLVISYLGALGFANGLDYLMACARACQKANLPVHFLVAGQGAAGAALAAQARSLQLTNLTLLGALPRDGVRDVLAVTDAIFVCYRQAAVLETGSPNKYFDGLAAGKLVVINFGGWIRAEVERTGCGIWVNPQQPETFVSGIAPFVHDAGLLQRYQSRARQLAETNYARTLLSQRFVSLWE
jgi:glycosyltransferase involved in cell wall biosynthesis